jgi:hypothetical protein
MKRLPRRRAMLLSFLIIAAAGAQAQPSISRISNIARITFNPDGRASASGTVTIKCGLYYGVCTVVLVDLGYTPTQTYPLEGVSYTAYKNLGTKKLTITTMPSGPDEVLQYTFPSGSSKNATYDLPFDVYAEPTTFPVANTYTVNMRADLYASDFPLGTALTPLTSFSFQIKVNTNAAVSVVDPGFPFSFTSVSKNVPYSSGIYEGAKAYIDVVARTNTTYTILITSTNGSRLVTATDPNTIPYTLTSNGSSISFAANPNLETAGTATGAFGKRYALVFTISTYTEMPVAANDYNDTLGLTMIAP